jgi:hypothetical protein
MGELTDYIDIGQAKRMSGVVALESTVIKTIVVIDEPVRVIIEIGMTGEYLVIVAVGATGEASMIKERNNWLNAASQGYF